MIKAIQGNNIFSWENLEFSFEQGVTLIEGFNFDDGTPEGSGKSAIVNAVCWGLYGAIPKDAKIDDVIREGCKSAFTRVELTSGHTVVRSRKPNDVFVVEPNGIELRGKDAKETQLMIEKLLGMSFETFCQAVYFPQGYPRKFITANEKERAQIISEIQDLEAFSDARKTVLKLITIEECQVEALNREVERQQTFITGLVAQAENIVEMIKAAQAEHAARVEKLEVGIADRTADLARIETEINKLDKASLEVARAEGDKALAELQEARESLKAEQLAALKQVAERARLESELALAQELLQSLKTEYASFEKPLSAKELEALIAERAAVASELEASVKVEAEFKAKAEAQKQLIASKTRMEARHKVLDRQIATKAAELEALSEKGTTECPTCGGPMSSKTAEAHKKHLTDALEELAAEFLELEGHLEEAVVKPLETPTPSNLDELRKRQRELQDKERANGANHRAFDALYLKLETAKQAVFRLQTNQKEIETANPEDFAARLEDLNRDISSVKKENHQIGEDLKRIEYAEYERGLILQQLGEYQADLKKLDSKVTERFEAKYESLVGEVERADAAVQVLQREFEEKSQRLTRLRILKDSFKEVQAYVFKTVLAELSRKSNKFLGELFDVPVSIEFTNEDEEGGLGKILAQVTIEGVPRPLGLYSGGQFRRIQLAVDLALSEIISSRSNKPANLRIFDEPFKDLSAQSVEKALRLFSSLKGSTVIIEHNVMVKAIVNKVYHVEFKDGVSKTATEKDQSNGVA